METTFYAFQSNLRYFLSQLLKDPINCKVGDFFKERNFSKKKLINILIKRDVIKRHEKIDDEENYNVKYNIIRKNFERKLKRIYNKYFETPDTEIDEATACGVSSGAFVQPLATPIKRKIGENIENMNKKRIFITEKQFEMLKETLTTFNAGDYQYTVPFPVKKNDPSMKRKPGFSMKRMK
jgi:hypothetical protein